MSREVRRVPASWEHPKDENESDIPLRSSFSYNEEEIQEGLRDGWLEGDPPHYGCDVMPDWSESERTHYQMYQTTTEGTPISPVMETPEELARWLVDNNVSAFASQEATYEEWLSTIERGWAFSAGGVLGEGLVSGVEGLHEK